MARSDWPALRKKPKPPHSYIHDVHGYKIALPPARSDTRRSRISNWFEEHVGTGFAKFGFFCFLLTVVVMVVGGGYLGWQNRDKAFAMVDKQLHPKPAERERPSHTVVTVPMLFPSRDSVRQYASKPETMPVMQQAVSLSAAQIPKPSLYSYPPVIVMAERIVENPPDTQPSPEPVSPPPKPRPLPKQGLKPLHTAMDKALQVQTPANTTDTPANGIVIKP